MKKKQPYLEIKYLAPSKLVPYQGNPRLNEQAVDPLRRSIEHFGFLNPIIARRSDNMIIAGHTRWKAALKDNLKTVPVIFVDLSENDAKLYNLADNKLPEISEWDISGLEDVLTELQAFDVDISIAGFGDEEEGETSEKQEEILKPYKQTHILLSFAPEKILDLQPYLESILAIEGIEYEQSSN